LDDVRSDSSPIMIVHPSRAQPNNTRIKKPSFPLGTRRLSEAKDYQNLKGVMVLSTITSRMYKTRIDAVELHTGAGTQATGALCTGATGGI
jgi:hypothetical protein